MPPMALVGSAEATERIASKGIVAEITIGSADIDMLHDPADSDILLGPCLAIGVLSGSGTLYYVDDETGTERALTGLSSSSDDIDPIAIRSINGTGNTHASAALTLRCRW